MLLLAVCTSTPQCSVGLGTREGLLAEARLGRPHAHAEFVAPAVEFCARSAGVSPEQIGGIVVDRGPGLFSGLRVGIATAKMMALSLGVPMMAFPSLDLLAFAARHSGREVVAVIDARRGEVFTARYAPVPGGVERLGQHDVCTPEALASDLMAAGREVLAVGTGALHYRHLFEDVGGVVIGDGALAHPTATSALELAADRFDREEFGPPASVTPLYLRRSDAEIKWEARREAAD